MNKKNYITCIMVVLFAFSFAYVCSIDKFYYKGMSALNIFAMISFLIHWIIFIPSYIFKTEKFYDITGTIAYLMIFTIAYYMTVGIHPNTSLFIRSIITISFISIWAIRLGFFLLIRVFSVGEDKRFRTAKTSFSTFLMYFTISGLWVFLTTCNALTIILNNSPMSNDIFFIIGIFAWIIGFSIEAISDEQKRRFRNKAENKNKFIISGLWKISRHPNYFGEILQWIAIAIISLPVINGWQYLTLASPLFVIILLTKVSGINLLEKNSDEKWGSNQKYLDYKKNTPVLMPFMKINNK